MNLIRKSREKIRNWRDPYVITDKRVQCAFLADADNPFLVSFPRTGSHWLRLLLELYFERPSLVRVFFYPNRTDYLTWHTHDLSLTDERKRVIYLYRDPVATIYSQMRYHRQQLDDAAAMGQWVDLYGDHLLKWLHTETFTEQKVIVCYERLRSDLAGEFAQVCDFFDVPFDASHLERVAEQVSKERVKGATSDRQVVNVSADYALNRDAFRERYSAEIWEQLLAGREALALNF